MRSGLPFVIRTPLSQYLQKLGTHVYRYDGFQWFETMLTGMAAYNAMFQENAFMHCPHGHPEAIQSLRRHGVRLAPFEEGEKTLFVNNDEPHEEIIKLLRSRNFPNPGKHEVTLVEKDGLRFNDVWRSRLHGACEIKECCLEELPDVGGTKILTTDWQAAVIGHVMGMRVVFVAGPRSPGWMSAMTVGSKRFKQVNVVDRDRRVACPCASVQHCHQREAESKPCIANAIFDIVGVLKETK